MEINEQDAEHVIEQRLKVIIVGESGSGKNSVAKGADICVPFKTFGVSIGKKTNIDKKINYKLTLIFWTLTKGRPLETTYFHGASAAIIVGDLGSKRSINKMRKWAGTIHEHLGKIPLFFIGTKENSKAPKSISPLIKLADDFNSHYFILSRSKEDRLKPIFKSIAKHLGRMYSKLFEDDNYIPT